MNALLALVASTVERVREVKFANLKRLGDPPSRATCKAANPQKY
jgi:hypothetical protein